MNNIFSSIFSRVISPVFKASRQTSLKLLKIEVARCRINIVKKVRLAFLGGAGVLFLYSFFTSGFLMLAATCFIILMVKFGVKTAVIFLFISGALCCLIPITILSIVSSEKAWLKHTDCDSILDDVFSGK